MLVLPDKPTIYVDVDETLVSFEAKYKNCTKIKVGPENAKMPAYINEYVVDKIKEFRARDHTIVVWSAGGSEWAATIIRALKMEDYVSVVMSKPAWFFDDQPAINYMPEGNRIYLRFDGTYVDLGGYSPDAGDEE